MEYALAGGSKDGGLISPLQFEQPPSQTYVQQRRQARWLPTGASSGFTPTGMNMVRLTFTGTGWLDLSTMRIQSQINASQGTADSTITSFRVFSGPANWVDRFRISSQGTVLEDCHYYYKAHLMCDRLCSAEFMHDEHNMGWAKMLIDETNDTPATNGSQGKIYVGLGTTGQFIPRAMGLIRQGRWWPLSYAPLTFELWISDKDNWVVNDSDHGFGITIDNVCAFCDVVTLDSSMEESWSKYLLSGRTLTFPTTQIIGQYSVIPASKDVTVSLVRALTRLRSAWVIFGRDDIKDPQHFQHPDPRLGVAVSNGYCPDTNFSAQMSVGSRLFPESPMDNWTHMYSQLKQTVGQLDSTIRTMFPMSAFCNNHQGTPFMSFMLGFPFMRCDGYSNGIGTRAGDLLTLRLRNIPQIADIAAKYATGISNTDGASGNPIQHCWIFLFADVLVQVGDGSIVVLD